MVTLAAVAAMVGLCIGLATHNSMAFARSGAVVVAIGLVLFSRASVIGKDIRFPIITAETGLSHLDPEHYRMVGESVPEWVNEDRKSRAAVGTWGPIVSAIGTLIWGFGDLLHL